MGRTNLDIALAKLEHEIKVCENHKKRLLKRVEEIKNKCLNKEINYYEYEHLINKRLDGKTIQEWLNYYESYIKKCEKNIKREIRKFKRNKVLLIFSSLALISLIFLSIFYLRPIIVGFITQEQENIFTEKLNLEFDESQNYEWELENMGILDSVKLSGLIEGNGEVKIYLDDLLILDSSEIKSEKAKITGEAIIETKQDKTIIDFFLGFFQKAFLTITGKVSEEENSNAVSEEDSEKSISSDNSGENSEDASSSETTQESAQEDSESQTQESHSEETEQEETLQKEISPSQEEIPPTSEETEEETGEEMQETAEEPQEETKEPTDEETGEKQITLKRFENLCEETCNLKKLVLNKSSYTLKMQISNAKLNLDEIVYEITEFSKEEIEEIKEPEEPIEKPEEIAEENITESINTTESPVLIKEIPDVYIKEDEFIELKISEYFQNAEKYYFLQVKNISTTTYDHTLKIEPDKNFTGQRESKIITSNSFGKTESNFFKIIVSGETGKEEILENKTETNITQEIPENKTLENLTEANASIITTQYKAVIGEPVKWKKQINLDEPAETFKISLPKQATNISVNKIFDDESQTQESHSEETEQEETLQKEISPSQEEIPPASKETEKETGEETQEISEEPQEETKESIKQQDYKIKEKAKARITGIVVLDEEEEKSIFGKIIDFFKKRIFSITGRAITTEEKNDTIEIIIEDNATEYEIIYETPAPQSFEQDISFSKKQIIISASDELNYTNILAYTYLQQEAPKERIKLYWIRQENHNEIDEETNETITELIEIKEEINVTKYDLNNNSLIDYIEWVVPHLSNQTYELIIEISKAEHLDESKNFISDIYEFVKAKDGNWSETIPAGHYIKVTFQTVLDDSKDITIYPRVTNGTPRIEVYEINGTEKIAEFTSLNSNEYNKIYLTSLEGEQDTFELLVVGGTVEFEHILDPAPVLGTREGIFVYGNGTNQNPFYRMWNGSVWSSELTNTNSVGGTIEWVMVSASTTRDEYLLVTADASDDINIQINGTLPGTSTTCWHNGTACGGVWEVTAYSTQTDQQKADVKYEQTSGDAIIVWSDNTTIPKFSVWNGTGFTASKAINDSTVSNIGALTLSGVKAIIQLEARANSDEVALLLGDINNDSEVIIWNGSAWNCESTVLSATLGNTNVPKLDGGYENSGDLLVVSPYNATAINSTQKAADTCTFTSSLKNVLNTGWIDVSMQLGTNYAIFAGSTGGSTDDMDAMVWNGSTWINVSSEDTGIYASEAAPNRLFAAGWAGTSPNAVVVYSDAANSVLDWYYYNKTTGAWNITTKDFTPTPTFYGPAENNIKTYSFIDENKTFAFLKDDNATANKSGIWAKVYNGSDATPNFPTAWSNTKSSPLTATASSIEFPNFGFAWQMFEEEAVADSTYPTINITYPTNNTNLSSANFYLNYTFVETYPNFCWYSNNSGMTNSSASTAMGTNFTLKGMEGYNNLTLWCNDTANNRNYSRKSFTIDTSPPYFENLQNQTITDTQKLDYDINASDAYTEISTFKINWTGNFTINATNGSLLNSTILAAGEHKINVSINDSLGNLNSTVFIINVTSADSPPGIIYVYNSTMTDVSDGPTEAITTNVTINFSVYDENGASNLNSSMAKINFTGNAGLGQTRTNSSCNLTELSGNYANYTCNVTMWWWDNNGTWNITAYIQDNDNNAVTNTSATFQLGTTTGFSVAPANLTWSSLLIGNTNQTPTNGPFLLNNTGNQNISTGSIKINATNLTGETDNNYGLWAGNFSVSYTTSANKPECSSTTSTAMVSSTFTAIGTANLTAGNYTSNNNITGQEQLWVCLRTVGSELINQAYSTKNRGAWTITILFAALIIKKKKLNKKQRIELTLKKLKIKYDIDKKEILEILKEQERIPVTIFLDKLGALESLTKYMKENLEMSYHQIAGILNRNERTIWTAYNKAKEKEKQSGKIKPEKTRIYLPINLFKNRRLTVLESTIIYLKEKGLKYSQIAKLINRDQRNVWTTYSKAMKKLSNSFN